MPPDFDDLLAVFLRNPDGPEGLALQSAINRGLQPRIQAAEVLTEALALQSVTPGVDADTAVMIACAAYEAIVQPLDQDLMADFRQSAARRVHERRCQPPPIESIVTIGQPVLDAEYDLDVDMGGLRGAWHRLWGIHVLVASGLMCRMENPDAEVRAQVDAHLGRALSDHEHAALVAHAHATYLESPEAMPFREQT
jgi:hypothetical protein